MRWPGGSGRHPTARGSRLRLRVASTFCPGNAAPLLGRTSCARWRLCFSRRCAQLLLTFALGRSSSAATSPSCHCGASTGGLRARAGLACWGRRLIKYGSLPHVFTCFLDDHYGGGCKGRSCVCMPGVRCRVGAYWRRLTGMPPRLCGFGFCGGSSVGVAKAMGMGHGGFTAVLWAPPPGS